MSDNIQTNTGQISPCLQQKIDKLQLVKLDQYAQTVTDYIIKRN